MDRRRFLGLVGGSSILGVAGCQASDPSRRGAQDPERRSTTTKRGSPDVRRWARTADSSKAARAEGDPISITEDVTDRPGVGDHEHWVETETAEIGRPEVATVTARRLGVKFVSVGYGKPPDGVDAEGVVIKPVVDKVLQRDGEVQEWPVATFPALVEAAPRSVDVTLIVDGDTVSRTVPVFARYLVLHQS